MQATIGRTELTKQVAEKVGTVPNLYNIIGAVFETVVENLAKGDEVLIRNFGTFKVKERKEKIGRNPQTGEEITIPAHKTPIFTASKFFKRNLN